MALTLGGYDYLSHADTAVAYQTALEGIADAIATVTGWSRVYSAIYDSDYVLVVDRHVNGDELSFVAGIGLAPLDTSNSDDGSDGDDDRLYISYKPATGTTFPTGAKDPRDSGYCSDCGAFLFSRVDGGVDLRSSNRRINFIADTATARLWFEFITTPGGAPPPGDPTGACICSPFGSDSMFTAGSLQSGDVYGGYFVAWDDGDLTHSGQKGQVYDTAGSTIGAVTSTGSSGGRTAINSDAYNASYNPAQPWIAVEQSVSLRASLGGGRKGVVDKDYLLWIRPAAVSNKTKIDSGSYLHLTDGMVWPWNNAWTPV